MRNLYFISGLPRSGTTWLAKIIGKNNNVNFLSGEFLNPGTTSNTFGLKNIPWFATESKLSPKQLIKIKYVLLLNYSFLFTLQRFLILLKDRNYNPKNYLRIIKHSFYYFNGKDIFTKDPIALFFSKHMITEYNAKVVFLNRNPYSFASSMKRVNWQISFDYLPERFKKLFQDDIKSYHESKENKLIYNVIIWWKVYEEFKNELKIANISFLEIDHELVIQNPEFWVTEILNFYGLKLDEAVKKEIQYYKNQKGGDEKLNGSIHQMNRSGDSILNSWKKRLTDQDCDIIKSMTDINS